MPGAARGRHRAALAAADDGPRAAPNASATADAGPAGPGGLGTVVRLVRSLPGVGGVVAGALVAEAAAALLAADYHALRTHGGTAPVTKQSGKQRVVAMRYACNQRLRTALYHWARVSTQHDAAARQYYATLRARGHSHARALRSLGDRWLRILTAMLATGTAYDATQFAASPMHTLTPPCTLQTGGESSTGMPAIPRLPARNDYHSPAGSAMTAASAHTASAAYMMRARPLARAGAEPDGQAVRNVDES